MTTEEELKQLRAEKQAWQEQLAHKDDLLLQMQEQVRQRDELIGQMQALAQQMQSLQERLAKDSHNSHLPPSDARTPS